MKKLPTSVVFIILATIAITSVQCMDSKTRLMNEAEKRILKSNEEMSDDEIMHKKNIERMSVEKKEFHNSMKEEKKARKMKKLEDELSRIRSKYMLKSSFEPSTELKMAIKISKKDFKSQNSKNNFHLKSKKALKVKKTSTNLIMKKKSLKSENFLKLAVKSTKDNRMRKMSAKSKQKLKEMHLKVKGLKHKTSYENTLNKKLYSRKKMSEQEKYFEEKLRKNSKGSLDAHHFLKAALKFNKAEVKTKRHSEEDVGTKRHSEEDIETKRHSEKDLGTKRHSGEDLDPWDEKKDLGAESNSPLVSTGLGNLTVDEIQEIINNAELLENVIEDEILEVIEHGANATTDEPEMSETTDYVSDINIHINSASNSSLDMTVLEETEPSVFETTSISNEAHNIEAVTSAGYTTSDPATESMTAAPSTTETTILVTNIPPTTESTSSVATAPSTTESTPLAATSPPSIPVVSATPTIPIVTAPPTIPIVTAPPTIPVVTAPATPSALDVFLDDLPFDYVPPTPSAAPAPTTIPVVTAPATTESTIPATAVPISTTKEYYFSYLTTVPSTVPISTTYIDTTVVPGTESHTTLSAATTPSITESPTTAVYSSDPYTPVAYTTSVPPSVAPNSDRSPEYADTIENTIHTTASPTTAGFTSEFVTTVVPTIAPSTHSTFINDSSYQRFISPFHGLNTVEAVTEITSDTSTTSQADSLVTLRPWNVMSEETCGIARFGLNVRGRVRKSQTKILEGKEALPGSFPWQVAILDEDRDLLCGGTLIAPRWVLTAAHCIRKKLFVRIFEHHINEKNGLEVEQKVRRIFRHPGYNASSIDNDIALLRLPALPAFPTSQTGQVVPGVITRACLPLGLEDNPPVGTRCMVMGWGKASMMHHWGTDVLMYTRLPVIDQKACVRANRKRITENMFCAGHYKGGSDTCSGDSGGPLLCSVNSKPGEEVWSVYGVTSFGDGCGNAGKMGVYAKVNNYLDWMGDIMSRYL